MSFLEAIVSSIIGVSKDVGSTEILAEDAGIDDGSCLYTQNYIIHQKLIHRQLK